MNRITLLNIFIISFFSTNVAHAADTPFSLNEIIAMSRVLQTYALISATIVASVTCFVVFRNAKKMKGGIFGKVLNYFGFGMVIVFLGYLVEAYPALVSFIKMQDLIVVSNSLVIAGYIFMAVAATKLSRAIEGEA